jgi:hypothetical protein
MLMGQVQKMRGPPWDKSALPVFVTEQEQDLLAVYTTKGFKPCSLKTVTAQGLTNCNVSKNLSVFFL